MKREIIKELAKENSNLRVVFATSALSMGINMPFITRVIHISPPSSLEEYVQEIGRAGRSGLQSYAYLYYCNSDISEYNIKQGYITKSMVAYCQTEGCLREHLLKHFSFNKNGHNQNNCCIYCDPEFPNNLYIINNTDTYIRYINEKNMTLLTAELNDFIAEKDSLQNFDDFSYFFSEEPDTTEQFSNKVISVLENIAFIQNEKDVISHGITNSKDSKFVLELIEKYSVLKLAE